MQSGHVFLDNLDTSNGKRPLDDERVTVLMESIKELGLQQPIHIWAPDEDTVKIVAGRHRAEACRRLGWDEIPCVFVEMDEIDRERWEIAENLHRAELTALQQSEHIERWKELTRNKLAQVGPLSEGDKGGRSRKGGDRTVAKELGVDRKEVQRSGKIAKLNPEARKIAEEEHLEDNQSALLAAAKHDDPAEQVRVLKEWRKPKELQVYDHERWLTDQRLRKPVNPPEEPLNDIERLNKWKAKAVALLNEAPCPEARDWLRDLLDQPVMDARYG